MQKLGKETVASSNENPKINDLMETLIMVILNPESVKVNVIPRFAEIFHRSADFMRRKRWILCRKRDKRKR